MKNYKETKENRFIISIKDINWTVKVFILSVFAAFVLAMAAYLLTFMLAEPESVSEAIVSTASTATAKVTVTSNYIDLMWAIFIFNSIAAACTVIGTGLFLMVHKLLLADMAMRPKSRLYTRFSIIIEEAMMPFYRLLVRVTKKLDKDIDSIVKSNDRESGTIWQYCGYGKDEYRMFAYMLPYTVPLMILMVNGILMGIMLAFFTFNGAITGYRLFGNEGITIGLFYNVIYFFISIIPHGIIEIPTILVAASMGHRFAFVQAQDVISKDLFSGNDIFRLKNDAYRVHETTKEYLLSAYTWKMLALIVLTLLIAAYIETYVTLKIVEDVMLVTDNYLKSLIGSA